MARYVTLVVCFLVGIISVVLAILAAFETNALRRSKTNRARRKQFSLKQLLVCSALLTSSLGGIIWPFLHRDDFTIPRGALFFGGMLALPATLGFMIDRNSPTRGTALGVALAVSVFVAWFFISVVTDDVLQ